MSHVLVRHACLRRAALSISLWEARRRRAYQSLTNALNQPAIDAQDAAGDVTRGRARQERHDTGELIGPPIAPGRNHRERLFYDIIDRFSLTLRSACIQFIDAPSLYPSRHHHINGDAIAGHFSGDSL